jgi:hypothetical protein
MNRQEQTEFINTFEEVCQGFWKTLKVSFKDNIYYVRIENDDFNNQEIKVFGFNNKEIEENEPIYEEVINYLEEEKEI